MNGEAAAGPQLVLPVPRLLEGIILPERFPSFYLNLPPPPTPLLKIQDSLSPFFYIYIFIVCVETADGNHPFPSPPS